MAAVSAVKENTLFYQAISDRITLSTRFDVELRGKYYPMQKLFIATVFFFGMCLSNPVFAQDPIKIGVLATLEGAFTVLGEDSVRGVKAALEKHGNKIGDQQVELVVKSTDTTPTSTLKAARNLIDDKVDIIVGPISSEQGIALKNFSKTKVQTTFINGISGAIETTYVNPSQNFFRFNTDNAQWSAGLGDYIYNEKAYKKVAIVAHDYAFNHAQVFGFEAEYCAAGGKISKRHWLSVGDSDYNKVIKDIQNDVDAIYLGLSGSDAIRFARQYKKTGSNAKLIGSSITVDGALLNAPEDINEIFIGMPSAGPQADTWGNEDWQSFVKAYKNFFSPEQRFRSPSILATGYYNATSAALHCLKQVEGDLSQNQGKFRQCLSTLELQAPNGPVRLDENRQAVGNNYISEVIRQDDGSLVKKLVRIRESVNQTLGLSKDDYNAYGLPSRDQVVCIGKN